MPLSQRTLKRLGRVSTRALNVARRRKWDDEWHVETERPEHELSQALPTELVDAVESGWIGPASQVFDIGSGRGQVSAWLAEQGMSVMGGDLSATATELAEKHFGHVDGVEFRTVDICADRPEAGRFDALVDRGCFHCIPEKLRPRYIENVHAWARPGSPFLMLTLVSDKGGDFDTRFARREAQLREWFDGRFEIERTAPTAERLSRSVGVYPRISRDGMTLWMRVV